MIRFALIFLLSSVSLTAVASGQIVDNDSIALERTGAVAAALIAKSYPEIKLKKVRFKIFKSDTNFFKARFSAFRFAAFGRMRHLVFVNPEIVPRGLGDEALTGALAHELAHVSYYTRKNRFQLFGLIRLVSGRSNARFERKADLEAIIRGYGRELIAYRMWLFDNIPSAAKRKKLRNYFSPEEIGLIIESLKAKPELALRWKRKVPLSIDEIRESAKN